MSDNSSDKLSMSDKKRKSLSIGLSDRLSDKEKYPKKSIRLSNNLIKNWDPQLIKWVLSDDNIEIVRQIKKGTLLSGGLSDKLSDKKTNENMKDRLFQDKLDDALKFKSGFEILAEAFTFAMQEKEIQIKIGKYFRDLPAGKEKFEEIRKLIKNSRE